MTTAQARIVSLIEKLPLGERRSLMHHLEDEGILEGSFYASMTEVESRQLKDGIAQADRGETVPADEALDRIAALLGLKR